MIRREREIKIRQDFPFSYSIDGGESWVSVDANTDITFNPETIKDDTLMIVSDSPDATFIDSDGLRLVTGPYSAVNIKNGRILKSIDGAFKDVKIEDIRLANLDVCESAVGVFENSEVGNISSIYLPNATNVSRVIAGASIKNIGVLDFPIATNANSLAKDSKINVLGDITIGHSLQIDCDKTDADSAFENSIIDIFPNVLMSEVFTSRYNAAGSTTLKSFFKGLDTKYMLSQIFETNNNIQDSDSLVAQYFSDDMFDGSTVKFAGIDLIATKGSVGGLAKMDQDAKFVSRIFNDVDSYSLDVPQSYEDVQEGSKAYLESSDTTGEYQNNEWMPNIIELESFNQIECKDNNIVAIGALDNKHIGIIYADGSKKTSISVDPLKNINIGEPIEASNDFVNIKSISRNGSYVKYDGNGIVVTEDDGVTIISSNNNYSDIRDVQFVGDGDSYTVLHGASNIAIVNAITGEEIDVTEKSLKTGESLVSAYLSNIEFGNLMVIINNGTEHIARVYDGFDGLEIDSDISLGDKSFLAHNYIERAEILAIDLNTGDVSRLFIGHKEI